MTTLVFVSRLLARSIATDEMHLTEIREPKQAMQKCFTTYARKCIHLHDDWASNSVSISFCFATQPIGSKPLVMLTTFNSPWRQSSKSQTD